MILVSGRKCLIMVWLFCLPFLFISCRSNKNAADKARSKQLKEIEQKHKQKEKELQKAYELRSKRIYDIQDDDGKKRIRKARQDQKKWSQKGESKSGFFLFRWFQKDKKKASCR